MPEYIEYVWFARFLEIWSLFLGSVIVFQQRKWPNQAPSHQSSLATSCVEAADEVLQNAFGEKECYLHWFPFGKNLICELTSYDGSIKMWLHVFLGTQGYPYVMVLFLSL